VSDFKSLEPAIDPSNRLTFLLDWELTMKCNLDCSYCKSGIDGGHDNTTKHPPLNQCIDTIDFMFRYVDLYMQNRSSGLRHVILNVYGGESLHHPNIVEILKQVHCAYREKFQNRWKLTVTTTTNAIIKARKLQLILPLIDEFTVSYHSENTQKQKDLFRSNIKQIQISGKRVKCVVLMHPEPAKFQDAEQMISWCQEHKIKFLPRQLDDTQNIFGYFQKQVIWFKTLYKDRSYHSKQLLDISDEKERTNMTEAGRACCGGRSLCKDQSYKNRDFYVTNRFPDWYCSVNQFFLYIKQVNGEIYTNKDCKMNYDGKVAPIGNLANTTALLEFTKQHLDKSSLPVIQCKKNYCLCGLCAPKAEHKDTFDKIMEKYHT